MVFASAVGHEKNRIPEYRFRSHNNRYRARTTNEALSEDLWGQVAPGRNVSHLRSLEAGYALVQ
jgi:hypothetical protein